MFEQLNTQVIHCTNVNLEYKSANKALTTKLDRYKEEVKDLKERKNVENKFSGSNEQYTEIERLKQTLYKQVQEKDSLMKTVSDLKNDLKIEENINVDKEIALEKKIKQLDNIIFKRVHAVKRIFRYLKHQPKLGLWYPRDSPFELEAFSDSDYAGASLDRKSTTGGCQFLGRRLISWQCKKQKIVANSTTKTEYVVAAYYCGQVLWIQNQMMDYGFNFMNTKIHINNESTIYVVKNPVYHSRTKHIEIRHHFIRDFYEKRLKDVLKIYTDSNVADLLTK
ncbi:hypothetical protein Tco_0067739, partial [Tanacetum coccineum]